MNLGNLISLTKCPVCGFDILLYANNQNQVMCEHCKSVIYLDSINFNSERDNKMKDFEPQTTYDIGNKVILNNELHEITEVGKSNMELEGENKMIDNLNMTSTIMNLGVEVCPTCGTELQHLCLTSMPPINKTICPKCKWEKKEEPIKITFDKEGIKLRMRIKYFEGATKLQKITKGNWIDVFANKDVFVPVGERAMIPLGFALELPQGWEGHLAPRSSTFKTWGVIQTNHVGIVDDSYIGDNDQWHMPVYCLQGKDFEYSEEEAKKKLGDVSTVGVIANGLIYTSIQDDKYDFRKSTKKELISKKGTWIRQGDKIGQFRIMEVMPEIEFEEVETFGNADRGGFGSTGEK